MNEKVLNIIEEEVDLLNKEIESTELKMTNMLNKYGLSYLEKINKLNYKKEILEYQVNKLYEIIGKIGR
ncbi:hypothetical protein [Clostridium butyricum]|uniref:hypothetical protein n=1 Tax=Clostridium butyricum TaxID=1492 RepID=UPI00325B054A